jgi:pre-mRNA-processing factor 8
LSVYKLTADGLNWGKKNLAKGYSDANAMAAQPNPPEYTSNLFEKVQMILSDKFLGFFMVPEGGAWNYNFNGQNFSPNMHFTLMLDNPKDFYHETHRAIHFLDFATRADEKDAAQATETYMPD